MEKLTQTPETEKHYESIVGKGMRATGRSPDFMRKLERERDEARDALRIYLIAGHKDARREASVIAKKALGDS